MYRNMLIVGPDKCGKTTLAAKISKKENCNVINLDVIISVFEDTFPKEDSDNYREFESTFITKYINEVTNTKNLIDGKKVVVEGNVPNLDAVIKGIDQDRLAIVGLTYDNIDIDKFAHDVKDLAPRTDMFKYLPDKLVKGKIIGFVEKNKEISQILEENDINCYDVSENRYDVFDEIIKDINELTSYSNSFKVKKK